MSSIREFAQKIGRDESTIRSLMSRGIITAFTRKGRHVDIDERAALAQYEARVHPHPNGKPINRIGGPAPEPAKSGNAASNVFYQSRAMRETYAARIAELDFKQRAGELISAEDAEQRWSEEITYARNRFLGLAPEARAFPLATVEETIAWFDEAIRAVLTDLAEGKGREVDDDELAA